MRKFYWGTGLAVALLTGGFTISAIADSPGENDDLGSLPPSRTGQLKRGADHDLVPAAAPSGQARPNGKTLSYFGGPVIGPGGSRQAARDIAAILNDGARQGGVRLTPNLLPVMP